MFSLCTVGKAVPLQLQITSHDNGEYMQCIFIVTLTDGMIARLHSRTVCARKLPKNQRRSQEWNVEAEAFSCVFQSRHWKVKRTNSFCCTIFTSQRSSFDLRPLMDLDRPLAVRPPCKGVTSRVVPRKVGFCTWTGWRWMELNTRKQMPLFVGAKLLACSGLALVHSLLLFPLHRFLSLFVSKFN